ncbi:MAG TPA: DNA primase [Woeseiaceae bacterium]
MSGLIPQYFIDDLIARVDIVEVLGRRLQLKKAGHEFKAVCPFHDEKTPSFTVSPQKGFYHCFGCGAHGTALGFLMEHDHMSFVDAVEELARQMGMEVPREESQRPARRFDSLFECLEEVSHFYQAALREHEPAKDYFKNRGIDGVTAQRFGLGYAPAGWDKLLNAFGKDAAAIEELHAVGLVIKKDDGGYYDRFRDRVMFPIRDARGRVIGFGGRVMGKEEPKYLNSPETVLFHKGQELYGLYEARQALRQIDRLVVVEGYMDVIALARHGINFAVATLGTATTDEHLNRLFRLTDEVIFCFDGDRAGRAAAWKALENSLPQLREGRQIRFAFLPDGQDPDSLVTEQGARAFEDQLDDGMALSDFLVDELAQGVDMTTIDGRARLAELAKPLLGRIPEGVYKALLLDHLADSVGLSTAKLEQMIGGASHDRHTARGAQKRPAKRRGASEPSVVRRAIHLVLNHPDVARDVDPERLQNVSRPGVELLRKLIETLHGEPHLTTAGLLERWRNRDEGQHLGKLATMTIPATDDFDAAAELNECVSSLEVAGRKERVKDLLEKGRLGPLDDSERTELRELQTRP